MEYNTRKWIKPEDLNPNHTLFGGRLLQWIDEEGFAIINDGTAFDEIERFIMDATGEGLLPFDSLVLKIPIPIILWEFDGSFFFPLIKDGEGEDRIPEEESVRLHIVFGINEEQRVDDRPMVDRRTIHFLIEVGDEFFS